MLRRVPFEKIENFRDLGGYATPYGETAFNVIYRSGSLSDATQNDLDKMAAMGIKSIIDLRDDKAKANIPDKTSLDPRFKTYLLPVNGNGRVPTCRRDMINSYLEMLEDPYSARKVIMTLATCEKPCVIHCTAGKDRTGSFISLLLLANGVLFQDVNADYMLSFAYLTRLMKETLTNYPTFPKAVLTPQTMFLPHVYEKFTKLYGSIPSYLETIGLDEDQIALFSNLLGKQEISAGAVIFRGNEILVEHMVKGHYSIPKGHVETCDKDLYDAVRREVKEEVNLDIDFLSDKTTSICYSPKPGVAKRVIFFLASYKGGDMKFQKEEISDAYWLGPNDAIKTLSHLSDRSTAKWAYEEKSKLSDK